MKNTFTMQKYIAVALATAMISSMGVTAFAAPTAALPVKAANTRLSGSTSSAKEEVARKEKELDDAKAALKEKEEVLEAAYKELSSSGKNTPGDFKNNAVMDWDAEHNGGKLADLLQAWENEISGSGTGGGDQGTGGSDQGTGSGGQQPENPGGSDQGTGGGDGGSGSEGAGGSDQGAGGSDQGTGSGDQGTGSGDQGTGSGGGQQTTNPDGNQSDPVTNDGEAVGDGTQEPPLVTNSTPDFEQPAADFGDDAGYQPNDDFNADFGDDAGYQPNDDFNADFGDDAGYQPNNDFNADFGDEPDSQPDMLLLPELDGQNPLQSVAVKSKLLSAYVPRIQNVHLQSKVRAMSSRAAGDTEKTAFLNAYDNAYTQKADEIKKMMPEYTAVEAAERAVDTAQTALKNAQEALGNALSTEDYDVKDIRLGDKETYKYDGDYYVAYPLEIKDGSERFYITDNGTGGTVDYDDVEDIDDLRLTVKIKDGSEYVKDYYIDEIESDDDDLDGLYAVILELKDNNTTKKQRIKGTITIKNKTKKLDDLDFSYSYDVDKADENDIDGVGDCEFDGEDVYINLVDFNDNWTVADFGKDVENIELEDNNGFYFEVKASDQGKVNLSYDNVAVKSVARRAPSDADLTFYNFYGYPEFDFTGRVTITPEDDYADEYYLYYIDKNDNLKLVNTKLNDDGDALEFKTRTLGRYVLSDMELDTDRDDDYDDDMTGEPSGPVEDPSMPGGTTGGKYNPATGL